MKLIRKLSFYLWHLMKMSTVNKVRIVLTSIGIFVAVFLFSAGNIISNSYYNGSKQIAEEMNEYAVALYSTYDPQRAKEELSHLTTVVPVEDELSNQKISILDTKIDTNAYLTVLASFHGVTGTNGLCAVFDEDGNFLPLDLELVAGRFFSTADLSAAAEVVVLDELTAQMLFPNENAVGQIIRLNVGIGGTTSAPMEDSKDAGAQTERAGMAEVIGVVKNSRVAEAKRLGLKRDLQAQELKNLRVETTVYCPLSALPRFFPEQEALGRYYLYRFEDAPSQEAFISSVQTLNEIQQRQGQYNCYEIITKKNRLADIENDLRYTSDLLNLIVLILGIICGLSIMSVAFFSVKERIPEIGIRKAFGASKADIVLQFIFEMVSIAFLVSVFAVCLSFYACKAAEGYLTSKLFMFFKIEISMHQMALPVLIGTLEAFLCSIIPSLYAAKIKVTDALRFE